MRESSDRRLQAYKSIKGMCWSIVVKETFSLTLIFHGEISFYNLNFFTMGINALMLITCCTQITNLHIRR